MYEGIGEGIKAAVIVLMIIAGLVGWALIEAIIWVFSHISISWI